MQFVHRHRYWLVMLGAILFYLAGVRVRESHGIRVIVQNNSGQMLQQVSINLEHGKEYPLGDLVAGRRIAIFVEPAAEDSIRLLFSNPSGNRRDQLIAGYVERGYCGEVRAHVLPGGTISASDESFTLYNWKSWWAFLG